MLSAVGGLALATTVLAVVIDLGRLSLCRQRLQFAADAAALAAASELEDASVLYPGEAGSDAVALAPDGHFQAMAAEAQAEGYVADNVATSSFLGISAPPTMELALGVVDRDGFSEQEANAATAVEVSLAFSKENGNALSLMMMRWFGGDSAKVHVRSVAKLDRAVVGFKPSEGRSVPCMPFVLQCGADNNGWVKQSGVKTNLAFNDRFRFDALAGQSSGSDGIPELVFTVGVDSTAENPVNGWIARFGTGSHIDLVRQLKTGLNVADLEDYGGELALGEDGMAVAISPPNSSVDFETLVEEMRSLQGQSRVWPLGRNNSNEISIEQFAAGRLVDCYLVKPGVMAVVIQPSLMQTNTAQTRPGAAANPWIAKLELAY